MVVVLAGLIVASLCLLRAGGYLQLLELTGHDLLLTASARQETGAAPVVLVGITEEEIQSLGRWPLTDDMLVATIEEILSYRPRVIGVDIYRDLAVPPGSDSLADLLATTENLIMIQKVRGGDSPPIEPPAVLAGTDRIGFSDMVIDPGGAVRRGLLFLDAGQQVYYSFALMLVINYLQTDGISPREGVPDPTYLRLGEVTIPPFESNDGAYVGADAGGYQFLLNFRGGREPFRKISLTDLHNPDIADTVLGDSIVILGVTAESVKDGFITPFSQASDYVMPGIALHGHIVAQLLRMARSGEQPLGVVADRWEYLLVTAWGILGALVAVYIPVLWQFVLVIAAGLGAIVWIAYMALLQGWWLPQVPPILAWILSAGIAMVFLRVQERSERKLLMDLFSRNVSVDVAEEIWRQRDQFLEGERLAASEVTATVLFSDLENFMPLSETLGPVRLMEWLNRYMEIMAGLVMQHGGIVDDYFGDAIMADFGLPLARASDQEITQDARNTVDCALAMRAAIDRINEECTRQGFPTVRMRVGICTGKMVAGFLGNRERMKYTTIGDTVNTAARLESYGKELPAMDAREGACRILVNANTAERLGAGYRTEPVGDLVLKGKARPVSVFKVIARDSHVID